MKKIPYTSDVQGALQRAAARNNPHSLQVLKKQRKREEAELQTACSQLLELDGWLYLRTDPFSDAATMQAARAKLAARGLLTPEVAECLKARGKAFGVPGMADAQYRRYLTNLVGCSQVLWIEWKSLNGKPTVEQKLWIASERSAGALVWVAGIDFRATFDDFKAFYRESGFCNKPSLFR